MTSPFQGDAGPIPRYESEEVQIRRLQRWMGWGFLVGLAICLIGVNILTPSLLDHMDDSPLSALLLGICIAEVNLIALWGVMAPGRWLLRLPWAFALLTVMWYSLVIGCYLESSNFRMEEAIHLGTTLLMGLMAAMAPLAVIGLIFRWKLERQEDQGVREQMSIGLLLAGMTLLAILLAAGRVILPQTGFRLSMMDPQIFLLLGVVILFNLVQTTPAIWISFLPAKVAAISALAMVFSGVLLSGLEIGVISLFLGGPPDFWEIFIVFSAMNIAQVSTVMAVLVSMRLLGFRLQRRNGYNPFAEQDPPPPVEKPKRDSPFAPVAYTATVENSDHVDRLFQGMEDTDSIEATD